MGSQTSTLTSHSFFPTARPAGPSAATEGTGSQGMSGLVPKRLGLPGETVGIWLSEKLRDFDPARHMAAIVLC